MGCLKNFLFLALILLYLKKACRGDECCYEGDEVKKLMYFNNSLYLNGNFLKQAKWPNNTVYYDVDPHMDPAIRTLVAIAIDYMHDEEWSNQCVKWVQRRPDGVDDVHDHWVTFTQTRGEDDFMAANLGYAYQGVKNTRVYISYYYVKKNQHKGDRWFKSALLHEMMHIMGFTHEFTRWDRDCYVYISDYLLEEDPDTFEIDRNEYYYSPEFPYDMDSVMHYDQDTMATDFHPHDEYLKFGRTDGHISVYDWDKIAYVYCNGPSECEDFPEDCSVSMFKRYANNPKCFREGSEYQTPLTCNWNKGDCPIS